MVDMSIVNGSINQPSHHWGGHHLASFPQDFEAEVLAIRSAASKAAALVCSAQLGPVALHSSVTWPRSCGHGDGWAMEIYGAGIGISK